MKARGGSDLVGYTVLVGIPLDEATSRYSRVMKLLGKEFVLVSGYETANCAEKLYVPGRFAEMGRLRHLGTHT